MGGLSFKGVTDAHRDWRMRVFDRERWRRLLPLIIVAIRLEIVQDRVRVAFCFGPRWINNDFPCFAPLSLEHAVAGLS